MNQLFKGSVSVQGFLTDIRSFLLNEQNIKNRTMFLFVKCRMTDCHGLNEKNIRRLSFPTYTTRD